MHVDDRLATVLGASVSGETAAITQYRQLLDLLGRLPASAKGRLVEDAFARLSALTGILPESRRSAVLRDPGLRLSNPRLVALLAQDEPESASAAMAAAQLDDAQWQALIPRLPVRARGFLRYRRDLGPGASELLARLGVRDLVLTAPVALDDYAHDVLVLQTAEEDIPHTSANERDEIGALLRRIEAFQKARSSQGATNRSESPPLPMAEFQDNRPDGPLAFDFATDASGRVIWADTGAAPMIVGANIATDDPDAPVQSDMVTTARMRRRLPITAGRVSIEGATAVTGDWRLDAAPRFAPHGGRFTGYCGRLRRSLPAPELKSDPESDRMREMLHELRTPVNAIQGFAEIIQQQLFGPSPHEYRALAASIAADAAKLLAGFEELDRLARLESGALALEVEPCDFRAVLAATAEQLEPFLRTRTAALVLGCRDPAPPIALAHEDAARLAWRLLATLAAAATPGEEIAITIGSDRTNLQVKMELPISYVDRPDPFAGPASAGPQGISSSMFGPAFALRLARAEARTAGGDLVHDGENLALTLKLYKAATVKRGATVTDTAEALQTG